MSRDKGHLERKDIEDTRRHEARDITTPPTSVKQLTAYYYGRFPPIIGHNYDVSLNVGRRSKINWTIQHTASRPAPNTRVISQQSGGTYALVQGVDATGTHTTAPTLPTPRRETPSFCIVR
ncbi:hypothetical protein J6590_014378 [Homalodisca vitripennis]|nr:hypothetical protein J6590_014378 [Homalodisca vitripennis]